MPMLDWRWPLQQPLFFPVIAMLLLGWLMVSSASIGVAQLHTGNPAYYSIRHGIYVLLSLMVFMAFTQIPMALWQRFDRLLLGLGFLVLILVLVPGIGHEVNGSRRWLNFGLFNVQASEIAKLTAVFFLAGYLVRRQHQVRQSWKGFLLPFLFLGLMVFLLLAEPDFGAVVVLMGASLVMMFLGGVKAGQFFLASFGALLAGFFAIQAENYRVERLLAFRDPWAPEHVFSSGYQLTQSLIAFGRGDWFGVGLGASVQKLFYLPEAHTDFVFAIWAEEMGLLGALLALALLVFVVAKIAQVSWRAQRVGQLYGAYVAIGIASLLTLQIVINLGVNVGLLPTKGLTLPFYSYGGSSLLICSAMMAIVMRIHYEAQSLAVKEQTNE
ncbi:MAG: putative lipid II flippase FtsW [Bacterioplanes sp.]|nr:putative lipid II flippase FtsW [Bacterioplanes sp.]